MPAAAEALLAEVRDRHGVVAESGEAVGGGTASKRWRLDAEPPVVVRLSQYYPLADQRWSCRVAAEFAGEIPEAITPLKGSDGEAVFVWQGQPITVWPFVPGAPLNRQSPDQRRQAARLLAQLHKSARAFPSLGEGRAPDRDDREQEE